MNKKIEDLKKRVSKLEEMFETATDEQKTELKELNNRLTAIENVQKQVSKLNERIDKLEGLDLSEYLKDESEIDEVIDQRVANLVEIVQRLNQTNQYQRTAILDFMTKKAKVNKTDVEKIVETFEQYLDKLM